MIPVKPVPEPVEFDERARKPGTAWLAQNAGAKRPRDYWSPFREILADGYQHRCAYVAMYTMFGTVDHFRSCKTHPELAYEWTNYRYADPWVNGIKRHHEVLDPHEVGEGWFEILLPSMQLVATDKVPTEYKVIVERTLKILGLGHDERLLRVRRQWYKMYLQNGLSLEGLRKIAPLIAAAVEKQLTTK